MNKLNQFIREHKEDMDFFEPHPGHFGRFEQKLKAQQAKQNGGKRISLLPYLLRAAAVAILVTLSSLYVWDHFIQPRTAKMSLSKVSPEYLEVEQHFVRQVNYMYDEIESIELGNDQEQKQVLLKELNEMDIIYKGLQKELAANPGDERVIQAMINHYENKTRVMNMILKQLKDIQKENLTNTNTQYDITNL